MSSTAVHFFEPRLRGQKANRLRNTGSAFQGAGSRRCFSLPAWLTGGGEEWQNPGPMSVTDVAWALIFGAWSLDLVLVLLVYGRRALRPYRNARARARASEQLPG